MKQVPFEEVVAQIVREDPRYDPDAYAFLRDALSFTVAMLQKPAVGPGRHVTGRELLEGIRRFALQEFGPAARTVLREWGINRTDDFGHIVFNLVRKGVLGKTAEDRLEDFADVYDLDEALVTPFLPASQRPGARRPSETASTNSTPRKRISSS